MQNYCLCNSELSLFRLLARLHASNVYTYLLEDDKESLFLIFLFIGWRIIELTFLCYEYAKTN